MSTLPAAIRTNRVKLSLLAAALVAGYALPYVAGPFLIATARLGLIYALFALSINLLAGYGGLLSLGQAGIFGVAAYGVGYAAARTGGGHIQQIFWGLLAGLLVTLLFGLMAMRTAGVYFLMVTLAQGMIVYGLASSLEPVTGAENGLTGVYRPDFLLDGWRYYYLCLAVLLLCAGLMWMILRSPFGLALRGLRDSDTRLRMLGYHTMWFRLYGFLISGFFASVAGVLFAYNNEFVSPTVAEFNTSAQAILMIILGGIGTMSGPVIGAFAIVYIQNVLSLQVERWPTVMGVIFILVIVFARNGLVGGVSRGWAGLIRRRGTEPPVAPDAGITLTGGDSPDDRSGSANPPPAGGGSAAEREEGKQG